MVLIFNPKEHVHFLYLLKRYGLILIVNVINCYSIGQFFAINATLSFYQSMKIKKIIIVMYQNHDIISNFCCLQRKVF